MGTGHFTRWLAEVATPGTEIYAFDSSWPMIARAVANTEGHRGVLLFRANARGPLPFREEAFDLVFQRLAPLGPADIPSVRAAHGLLRPGGWYFQAGWERPTYATSPVRWAIDNGFERAEFHEWRYLRVQSQEEYLATLIEARGMDETLHPEEVGTPPAASQPPQDTQNGIPIITDETLLMARKPAGPGTPM
jgi:SAM-dependent methyltransferase